MKKPRLQSRGDMRAVEAARFAVYGARGRRDMKWLVTAVRSPAFYFVAILIALPSLGELVLGRTIKWIPTWVHVLMVIVGAAGMAISLLADRALARRREAEERAAQIANIPAKVQELCDDFGIESSNEEAVREITEIVRKSIFRRP